MDKADKERIAAMAQTQEERLLLLRAAEKLERGQARQTPASTAFLTPREQALLRSILPQIRFFGGTQNAERKIAYYSPDYLDEADYLENGPVVCLRGSFYEKNSLTHRDVLGALMGAGIRRDAVGDISVRESECDIFVLVELAKYLLDNLTGAGRQHLSLKQIPLRQAVAPAPEIREMRVTVAALRLDSVLAAGFHLSRTAALEAVRGGLVAVDGLTCLKPDRSVSEGNELSLRGRGKLRLISVEGNTRKGRLGLLLGIYGSSGKG